MSTDRLRIEASNEEARNICPPESGREVITPAGSLRIEDVRSWRWAKFSGHPKWRTGNPQPVRPFTEAKS